MKYITSALVLIALLSSSTETSAIRLNAKFSDDLIKSLAEDMAKDTEAEVTEPAAAAQVAETPATTTTAKATTKSNKKEVAKGAKASGKNSTKKADKKKETPKVVVTEKKEEADDIPMDQAAIKAYSSVIADAAEDSVPSVPVQYTTVI